MQKRFFFTISLVFVSSFSFTQKVKERFISIPKKEAVQQQSVVVSNIPPGKTNEHYIDTNALLDTAQSQRVELTPELELDNFLQKQEAVESARRKQKDPPSVQNTSQSSSPKPLGNAQFLSINAIVLDAGHGGKDPGGIANVIEEKRLVLTLLKKIHANFRLKNKNISVFVTRKNDTFISLEERVSKTARWSSSPKNNVLFVSIHGNIARNRKVEGLEIYTLSDKASDSEALEVERLENAGFSKDDIVQTQSIYSILADLIRDGTRKQSEWLAQHVYTETLSSIRQDGGVGRGLKKANFFVLKYNTVPSILIEVGYMSHQGEAVRLKKEEYQDKLADGIYNGITKFIEAYNETEGFTK